MNYIAQSQGAPEPAGHHEEEEARQPLVIYHGNCLDGFTAAWACWLKYPDAEFVPGVYGQNPPDCMGRDVYLLDFSYRREVLKAMAREARKVVILDHHRSAERDLANLWDADGQDTFTNTTCIFDMDKSGARLAWEWFHPRAEVPLFVRLVEDRDLWRFAIQGSKELNTYFFSFDYDFKVWSELREDLETVTFRDEMYEAGTALLRKQDKDVRELVKKLGRNIQFAKCWDLYPQWMPCANLPYTLASDAAGLMAEHVPFAATYYQDAEGWFVFSLRSRPNGADVSEVAARYGGGGHRNAAGFRVRGLEDL